MTLFSTWTRKLFAGMALATLSNIASGQIESYPMAMPSANGGYPGMPSSEASCDAYSPGMGDGYGGMMGSGCDGGYPPGCGPGGEFGYCPDGMGENGLFGCPRGSLLHGRSLGDLFHSLAGRLAGLGIGLVSPYGEGGVASQRWFDIQAEAVVLKQENGAGLRAFSSQGQNPDSPDDFVLSTNDVKFDDYRVGMGLLANVQVGPGSNVEVGYFGLNKWSESAEVTSTTPTLYSFFSDFGVNPFDGFDDPDRSFVHRIDYESRLNNGEVNLRRRWAEPSGFFQGSYLAGIRYFQLDEQFLFTARGENNNSQANNGLRFFNYDAETRNQMTGFQIGADLWLNLIPGVKVGSEVKGGIFGNHAVQRTIITANSLPAFGIPSIEERASDGRTAYLVQWATQAIYRLSYSWTVRGSYQLIYVDNVALALENVNDEPPALFLPNSNRTVRVFNDGEIFYTGFTGGLEYLW